MADGNTPSEDREFLAFHKRNEAEALALYGKRALIVGGGATGSNVADLLGKAGMDLIVMDGENLELENLHRHIAPKRFVGQNKAEAIAKTLRAELPKAQRVWPLNRTLEQVGQVRLRQIVANVAVAIAATGSDAADVVLNELCRQEGTAFVAPRLWPDTEPVLGDIVVVPWQRRRPPWSHACYECLRPRREGPARPGLAAQRGLGVDIVQVANFTAQQIIALLIPDGLHGRQLTARLNAGRNYFVIPRDSTRLVPVETTRRSGCQGCQAPAVTPPRTSPPRPARARVTPQTAATAPAPPPATVAAVPPPTTALRAVIGDLGIPSASEVRKLASELWSAITFVGKLVLTLLWVVVGFLIDARFVILTSRIAGFVFFILVVALAAVVWWDDE